MAKSPSLEFENEILSFELVYLQEILSDFSGWGVKIQVYE